MPAREPAPGQFAHPALALLAATRPAFLSVTLVGVLLGLACAWADGVALDATKATLTLVFALLAHAGANVINDYYDGESGTDASNTERVFPFTGGSRFIQNGVLRPAQVRRLGYTLLAVVIPAGLWLAAHSSAQLLLVGLLGLLAAWAYSAPPLQLMARGWGEAAITLAWLMVVVGSDLVQRGNWAALPWVAGLPFALLVAAILLLNQFPDRAADERAAKRTLVVRLGVQRARWAYVALCVGAYGALALGMLCHGLPAHAALALLPLGLSATACADLLRHAQTSHHLTRAIVLTIAAANAVGLLLTVGVWLGRLLG